MSEIASHLCQACGLCCDGSMFSDVRLQPGDSAPALKQLGFRIQYKKRFDFFDQPCVAFKNGCCSVYNDRPLRCRVFECQQLKRLTQGEVTEEEVLKKIQEARSKIAIIKKLLYDLGPSNSKKPLLQQYQQIISTPVDVSAEKKVVEERALLDEALLTLNEFLNQEFRST
ncbi:MAG: YkgJ family cysteine cluster protein [Verrucomicrobia bacterium]|nr:YkgJ family cysteine cluster protein [Verrucomicrobiota bacterium]